MQATTGKSGVFTQGTMRKTTQNLEDLPGMSVTECLKAMPVCTKDEGYNVALTDAANVRTMISNFHSLSSLKFKTAKTETGIIIWREL